ncbi:MAG TPA: efflux RND transporter periplasmic adaptor subunit [Blastocatellia bacterium]|nr:efflux RND transporter periplasmic adaptor subunit [Blastocatellia bacterium]
MEHRSSIEVAETIEEQSETEGKVASLVVEQSTTTKDQRSQIFSRRTMVLVTILAAVAAIIVFVSSRILSKASTPVAPAAEAATTPEANSVTIDASQMQSIKLERAASQTFRVEKVATGKIAFNEEVMTPVFSPYTGRVIRLLAKPGEVIKQGSPLVEIDTPDLVQSETDLITAGIALGKSNATLELARRTEARQHRLYLNKAVSLKDWEQAEADVKSAEREVSSSESVLTGARSRLRAFGKTEAEIGRIEADHQVDRVMRVPSPIAGTITARKVGPGQYVKPDSTDPMFTVADLSSVWLLADVYESDAPLLKVGQPVEVSVSAFPGETFAARVSYIGPSVDPTTHRVSVRAVINNRGQRLKPEMFASFRITTNTTIESLAVPSRAVLRDSSKASVWVSQGSNQFVKRAVTLGLIQNDYAQIISGIQAGETVVVQGSLFLDNASNTQD